MKALLVLSIIGIILCSIFFHDFWASYNRSYDYELFFFTFLLTYIFVIAHAIVSLLQNIKRKNIGLIIMTSIGFVLYFCGLFTSINGYFSYWSRGFPLGLDTAIAWYILSFLFFLSMAIVGIVLFVMFLTEPAKTRSNYSSNKKCRQCGAIFSVSQSFCPKCNSSLYEETNQSIDASISPIGPINVNYGDTWTCKKCGEKNPRTSTFCKDCGESF